MCVSGKSRIEDYLRVTIGTEEKWESYLNFCEIMKVKEDFDHAERYFEGL